MTILFVIAVFMGTILGLHFKVLILVPTLGAVAAGIVVIGLADGFSLRDTALAGFVTITALQFGFLGGSALNLRDWKRSRRPLGHRPLALTRK